MLTPLYDTWARSCLPGPTPEEPFATCNSCVMCASAGTPTPRMSFRPDVKCCSYEPKLPNFSVGAILLDGAPDSSAARISLARRLAQPGVRTPLGVLPNPVTRALYDLTAKDAFGKATALVCPHYEREGGGSCTIWRYRNAVCATWFCKHEHGQVSKIFWNNLRDLFTYVEDQLSVWCADRLKIAHHNIVRAVNLASAPAREKLGSALTAEGEAYDGLFGSWTGKEDDYFKACANLVGKLSWPQAMDICGATATILWGVTSAAYESLMTPRSLYAPKARTIVISDYSDAEVSLTTYSPYDPLLVPRELPHLLGYFNGNRVEETLARIENDHGISLDRSVIQKLVDFGVLHDLEREELVSGESTPHS